MEDDVKDAFHSGRITEAECRKQLGELGLTATDIQELIDFYQPAPPENDDG